MQAHTRPCLVRLFVLNNNNGQKYVDRLHFPRRTTLSSTSTLGQWHKLIDHLLLGVQYTLVNAQAQKIDHA